jgi:hypothetical protein
VRAEERAWGERCNREVGEVHDRGCRGGGGVRLGREIREGPTWKRGEARRPCLEVVGWPRN